MDRIDAQGYLPRMMKYIVVALICSLPFAYQACKQCNCNTPCPDDPTPTPTPTDTIPTTDTIPDTPIIDTTIYPDTIFVPRDVNGNPPSEDTILFYRDKLGVKAFVFDLEEIPPEQQHEMAGWWWRAYRKMRDDLYIRRDLAPNQSVSARGTLYAGNFWAGNPYGAGALVSDSIDLANLGLKWEYSTLYKKQRNTVRNIVPKAISETLGNSR